MDLDIISKKFYIFNQKQNFFLISFYSSSFLTVPIYFFMEIQLLIKRDSIIHYKFNHDIIHYRTI